MVMQAWGQYGVLWPVVHQQLGMRPDLGFGRLEVVPQLPEGQSSIAGSDILVGDGSLDVSATHEGKRFTTTVRSSVRSELLIGHTIPDGSQISSVTLNGMQVRFSIRHSNRGQEILVSAGAGASQRLVVTTA
jgi:hypothetical protein